MNPPFMQWHHVELIHLDLLRILHWAETDMDEEVTEPISVPSNQNPGFSTIRFLSLSYDN